MSAIDQMSRQELRAAAKAAGIKYGKLSLFQIREALKDAKPVSKKKSEPKERKVRSGTKMEAALAVMTKYPDKARKEIIAKFIDDVGLTKAGAATYYSLVQKKMKTK
jgi:DNA-directed RNA polymerase specialized sigma24 family protein